MLTRPCSSLRLALVILAGLVLASPARVLEQDWPDRRLVRTYGAATAQFVALAMRSASSHMIADD